MQIAATHLASGAARLKLTYANLMEPPRTYCPENSERTRAHPSCSISEGNNKRQYQREVEEEEQEEEERQRKSEEEQVNGEEVKEIDGVARRREWRREREREREEDVRGRESTPDPLCRIPRTRTG